MNARRSEGLPLSFEVFTGNRADVTTVEEIVKSMEEKYGQAERVWVMDCGMVSELWRWCTQLTQAEAAFRTAESDLKLRTVARPEGRVAELPTRNRILGEVSPSAAKQLRNLG